MIANGYTTHVYCEIEGCFEKAEFFGQSLAQTLRQARRVGWAISSDIQRAYCPEHNRWKNKKKEKSE